MVSTSFRICGRISGAASSAIPVPPFGFSLAPLFKLTTFMQNSQSRPEGKGQILRRLAASMPERYPVYREPFAGDGGLFFYLIREKAFLSDLNEELINTFIVVKVDCEALLESLEQHRNTPEYYYHSRALNQKDSSPARERLKAYLLEHGLLQWAIQGQQAGQDQPAGQALEKGGYQLRGPGDRDACYHQRSVYRGKEPDCPECHQFPPSASAHRQRDLDERDDYHHCHEQCRRRPPAFR